MMINSPAWIVVAAVMSFQCVLCCQSIVWFLQVWFISSNTWRETHRALCWTGCLLSLPCTLFLLSVHETCLSRRIEQIWHVILTFRCDLLSFLTLTLGCLRFRDRWISTIKCKTKQSKYPSLLKCTFFSLFYELSIKPLYFTSPKSDQATGHRWILLKSDIFLQNSSTTSASSSSSPSYSSFFQAQWTEGKWHLITAEQSRSSANYDPGSSVIISN